MQTQLFINGEFCAAAGGGTIPVLNPYDNSHLCDVAEARAEDVDAAVAAAKAAQPAWARMDAADRGHLLLKLADAIEANADELIQLEAQDTGHPVRDARKLDVPRTSRCFRYFGGMSDKFEGFLPPVYPGFINYVQREPVGVV
ncbi:MAG: aldehyde dehydrogenase family protein, partial [Pseudomonadota bacterium]